MIWFVVILLFIINLALTAFVAYNLVMRVERCEVCIKELNESEDTEDVYT